jgi:SecD/SecF fusion protein
VYRVDTPNASRALVERTVEVMRRRAAGLTPKGIAVRAVGTREIRFEVPGSKRLSSVPPVGQTAGLYFYDWEANVLGPDGKPNPADPNVTGGPAAGQAAAEPFYDAVVRASRRPASHAAGATASGAYYLVDDRMRSVLGGPTELRDDLTVGLAGDVAPPGSRVVRVQRGTILVCAEREKRSPACTRTDRYYVLNDDPALAGEELTNIKQDFSRGAGGTGGPIVTFDFTDKGRSAWQKVTRKIAQRGQLQQVPGQSPRESFQHFAAVLDGALLTVPYIDFQQNPDGIDGANGADIEGGFTIATARDLARNLQSGALPVRLLLVSQHVVHSREA